MLAWRAKRQILAFLVVFGTIAVVAGLFIWSKIPDPTCFDKRQNQEEEGTDCGGPCIPCTSDARDVVVLWARSFDVGGGNYETAALVENSNLNYHMPEMRYTFKIYDSKNSLLSAREGITYANPQEKFLILGEVVNLGSRKPARTTLETEYLSKWKYIEPQRAPLVVSEKRYSGEPISSLRAYLYNQSLKIVRDVEVGSVLYDEKGAAYAASVTAVEEISPESGQFITFTWKTPFGREPSSSEIFPRTNLIKNY
jgi:hypothetical protein